MLMLILVLILISPSPPLPEYTIGASIRSTHSALSISKRHGEGCRMETGFRSAGACAQRERRDVDGVSVGRTLLSAAVDLGVDFDFPNPAKSKSETGTEN